jgi:hypothetical protein
MFINAKDTPFAVAMAFLAYATVRNFEEYPRPRIPTILLFGLALGLAVGTRVIGGIGLVFAAAGVAVLFAIDWRDSAGRGRRVASLRSAYAATAPCGDGHHLAGVVLALLNRCAPSNLSHSGRSPERLFEERAF